MKKVVQSILFGIVFIAAYLFIMPWFSWFKGDGYVITLQDIRHAVIIGIMVSIVMALSKKIKSTWLFIPLAICVTVILIFIEKLIFPVKLSRY